MQAINSNKIHKTKDKDGYYNFKCTCGKQVFLVSPSAKNKAAMICINCGAGRLL